MKSRRVRHKILVLAPSRMESLLCLNQDNRIITKSKKTILYSLFFYLFLEKRKVSKIIFFISTIVCFLSLSCTPSKSNDIDSAVFNDYAYQNKSRKDKITYLDSIANNFNISNRVFLFDLSSEYYYLNSYQKSIAVCNKALQISRGAKDTISIARAYSYIGDCYEVSHKDSAYFYYQKAERIYRLLNKKNKIGKMLFNKAYILFFEGSYLESEIELSKSLQYFKDGLNPEMLFSAYNLMGCNFEKLEEFDNALKYYQLAKDVLQDLRKKDKYFDKNYNFNVTSAINFSNIYEKTFQYDKSIKELRSVFNQELKKQWPNDYVAVLGNLGYTKMKSGDLVGVEALLKEALNISKQELNETNIFYELINLGEYYSIVNDTVQSINYLKQSLKLAEKIKAGEEIKTALKLLSKVDYRNDSFYDKRYISVNDSLTKLQRKTRNKYARIEYETSVVEDENKVLSNEKLYILIVSLSLILILICVLIYRYAKNKKRELEFVKQQRLADVAIFELLKEHQTQIGQAKVMEQNRISRELHDGVMNKLYGVRLQLGIHNESNADAIKEKRLGYIDLLQDIEKEIRTISHDLHTASFDAHFEYVSLLTDFIHQQNEFGTTHFTFDCDASIDWEGISGLVKITIYRIIQEAVFNVNKYAEAEGCTILLTQNSDSRIQLVIEDNGKGFDTASNVHEGIGLKNIKERAALVKALLVIDSELGRGTMIQVVFADDLK